MPQKNSIEHERYTRLFANFSPFHIGPQGDDIRQEGEENEGGRPCSKKFRVWRRSKRTFPSISIQATSGECLSLSPARQGSKTAVSTFPLNHVSLGR